MTRCTAFCLVVAGVWLAAPGVARADAPAEAAGHFQIGLKHAQAGELEQAAREFQRAYEISPHYAVLYNLGQTYVLMGKPAEAVDAFERYLAQGGAEISKERQKAVETSIAFQSKRLGEIAVKVEPADATVEIDGQPFTGVGSVRVAAGRHGLWFAAPGYQPRGASVLVEAGNTASVVVQLEPSPVVAAEAPASLELEVPPITAATSVTPKHETVPPGSSLPHEHESTELRWLAVGASLGVGVAGLAVGTYFGLDAHSEWAERNSHCHNGACDAQAEAAGDRARTSATISNIAFVAGIAGSALGCYLLFTTPTRATETRVVAGVASDRGEIRLEHEF